MDLDVTIVSVAFPGSQRSFLPGIERLTEGVGNGLCSRGVRVNLITSKRTGGPSYEVRQSGLKVYRVGSLMQYPGSGFMGVGLVSFCASVYKHYLEILRKSDVIQIISTSFIPSILLGANAPPVFSYFPHSDNPRTLKEFFYLPVVNKLEKIIFNRSDIVIAGVPPESPEIQVFQNKFGISPEKVRYVHEGFDPKLFTDLELSKEISKQYGDDIILYVGSLLRRKGVHVLLKAMPSVLKEIPSTQLLLIGSTREYGSVLRALTKRLNIASNIHFMDYVPDDALTDYYNSAKVFAFPSLLEGYPLVVLEAMASGMPVVASRLATIVEQLGDTGITFPPGDVRSLSEALIQLLQDDKLRASLGRATKDRALSMFTWSKIADEYLAIYEEWLTHK